MIRTLDTHEQKSPRFLIDAFPDIVQTIMPIGDYFSGEKIHIEGKMEEGKYRGMDASWDEMKGNLVEIKIGKDFGIHTEQLERFQDELYRMSCYRQKNPHVQLHAVWMNDFCEEWEVFVHYCNKYHVWAHRKGDQWGLIKFLKDLDTDKYKEFEPYIKRSHEEPTILAKMLRQFPGISSEKAIDLGVALNDFTISEWSDGAHLEKWISDKIIFIIGKKKDGSPRKLATQLIDWLETGEEP